MIHDFIAQSFETQSGENEFEETPKLHNCKTNFQTSFLSPSTATEIRCQEKSKGGLRYEVILAEPNVTQVQLPKAVQQNAAPKPLSAQEIADKLKAAEERRLVSWLHNPTRSTLCLIRRFKPSEFGSKEDLGLDSEDGENWRNIT